jgi:hypothetical protein
MRFTGKSRQAAWVPVAMACAALAAGRLVAADSKPATAGTTSGGAQSYHRNVRTMGGPINKSLGSAGNLGPSHPYSQRSFSSPSYRAQSAMRRQEMRRAALAAAAAAARVETPATNAVALPPASTNLPGAVDIPAADMPPAAPAL